jgi:hypothetical protein
MHSAQLIRLFEALADEQLALLYGGGFPDAHTAELITLGEEVLGGPGAEKGLRSRTGFVMVEAYQNVLRHAIPAQPEEAAGHNTFMFLHRPQCTEVVTVNTVDEAEVPTLQRALERLHGLGLDELKALFLQALQGGERTKRGGAGLGLIEMARRTGNALHHTLYGTPGTDHRFLLQVCTTGTASAGHSLEALRDMDALLVEQGCLLVCAGRMGPAVQEVVLRMIGAEREGGNEAMVRPGMAAMELINAVGTEAGTPLLAWCEQGGARVLHVALRANAECTARLLAEGAHLATLEPAAVHRRYRDAILGRLPGTGPELVGLLDMARHATAALQVTTATVHGTPALLISAPI